GLRGKRSRRRAPGARQGQQEGAPMRLVLRTAALFLAAALASAASAQTPPDNSHVPLIPFDTEPFIKLKPGQNLGEVLGVTVNSKGHVVILNHPGNSNGPLFGNSSTEIFEY